MRPLRFVFAACAALSLAACDPVPSAMQPAAATSAQAAQPRTFLYAHALFGEAVFDRDVLSFQSALAQGFGPLAEVARFGYTDRRLTVPEASAVTAAISRLAAAAQDDTDVVVVMFTTHGQPDMLAEKPADTDAISGISAEALAAFLAPLENDRQVIILQACYSGSLIDDLASPNRIILTAAAADRTSFGCAPDNDNTFFIKSLNTALSEGGTWSEIFARAKDLVRNLEAEFDIPDTDQSNPQAYVGRNMRDLWAEAEPAG